VIKYKGKKKFRVVHKRLEDEFPESVSDMSNQKAQEHYRKIIYGSSYERFFGKYTSINAGEAEILKYKKFSELKISCIMN